VEASISAAAGGRPSTAAPAKRQEEDAVAVRVAVHIRPLVESEQAKGCQEILDVIPPAQVLGHDLPSSGCSTVSTSRDETLTGINSSGCCCRSYLDSTHSLMIMSMAVVEDMMLPIFTLIVFSHWWMVCSRATMQQCSLMVSCGCADGQILSARQGKDLLITLGV